MMVWRKGGNCKYRYHLISCCLVTNRASLLINCSKDEASKIREQAARQRRSISGYVFNIVMRAVAFEEDFLHMRAVRANQSPFARHLSRYQFEPWLSARPPGPRTTMLLWCSKDEAKRIRDAVKRRNTTISGFVLHTLRSSWKIAESLPKAPGLNR